MLVLVQGPYIKNTEILITEISKSLPNSKIVISCYNEFIDLEHFKQIPNINIIRNDDPGTELIPPRGKPMNLKRQAKTIFFGCNDSKEKWVMKIRSDLKIVDKMRFIRSIKKFENFLSSKHPPRLITLNNGSLDIFSFYDMVFHFNDWFFICERKTLIENCSIMLNIKEKELIDPFRYSYPKNYFHFRKYRMIFHNEQMIHFSKMLIKRVSIKYCCQKSKFVRHRHLIWVAKYLRLISLRDIGLKSSKVGYPSLRTKLVAISFASWNLHYYIWKSKGFIRLIIFLILKTHGYLRKIIFLFLKYLSTIKNYNIIFIRNALYKILN